MAAAPTLYNNVNMVVLLAFADTTKIELGPGNGDESVGEISPGGRSASPVRNRGAFLGLVDGDSQEVSFSVTLHATGPLSSSTTGRPLNAILKTGFYEAKETVDPAGTVHTNNIEIYGQRRTGESFGVSLYNVRMSLAYASSAEGNTLSITGTAYGDGVHLPVEYS